MPSLPVHILTYELLSNFIYKGSPSITVGIKHGMTTMKRKLMIMLEVTLSPTRTSAQKYEYHIKLTSVT